MISHQRPATSPVPHAITRLRWTLIAALWLGYVIALLTFELSAVKLAVYEVYFQGARKLVDGGLLYYGTKGWVYLYPPLLAQALIPLASALNYSATEWLWMGLNLAVLAGSIRLLSRYVSTAMVRGLWLTPILFVPVGQALFLGQITIILFGLLTAVWAAVREDQREIAGLLLAVACWLKVYPALLVLYFVWQRDWRLIRGVAYAGTALLMVQVFVSGLDIMRDFFEVLLSLVSNGQPEAVFENMSILAFVSRLFQANRYVYPLVISTALFVITRAALMLMVFGVAVWAVGRGGLRTMDRPDRRFDLEYSLMVTTILLLGSTLWLSGLPPLLLVYTLILRSLGRARCRVWITRLITASFVMIGLHLPLTYLAVTLNGLHAVLLSVGFIGMMIPWAVLVILLAGPPAAAGNTPYGSIDSETPKLALL